MLLFVPPPPRVVFTSMLGLHLTVDLHCLIFVAPESGVVCAIWILVPLKDTA